MPPRAVSRVRSPIRSRLRAQPSDCKAVFGWFLYAVAGVGGRMLDGEPIPLSRAPSPYGWLTALKVATGDAGHSGAAVG